MAERALQETQMNRSRLASRADTERKHEITAADKIKKDEKKRAPSFFKKAIEPLIDEACEKGDRKTTFTVSQYNKGGIPQWARYRSEFLKEILESEGFTVQLEDNRDEPFGSDPLFNETVYSLYMHISW